MSIPVNAKSQKTGGWSYGDEGQRWPTDVGQIWMCGKHFFVCSDFMAMDLLDQFLAERDAKGQSPTLIYTDPPWGQSNLNAFQTKAGLEHASYTWVDIYRKIAALAASRHIPVWAEAGMRNLSTGKPVPRAIMAAGPHMGYWELVYYRKNPMGLYYAGEVPPPPSLVGPNSPLHGVDDDFTPGMVMSAYAAHGVVLDTCAGRGQTSRQAEESGWVSINNELNPPRMSAALDRMHRKFGYHPVRVR